MKGNIMNEDNKVQITVEGWKATLLFVFIAVTSTVGSSAILASIIKAIF